jgi:hypothetical protein
MMAGEERPWHEWRSVKNIPQESGWYLVSIGGRSTKKTCYFDTMGVGKGWEWVDSYGMVLEKVSHWMPMPPSPDPETSVAK